MKISAVVITYNEEQNLKECLETVAWADEIVVVDTGSTDKTIDIAKKFTSHIFTYEHVGYVEPVRNFALQKAKGEWILLLDADERVSEALVKKIEELVKAEDSAIVAYLIPRKNIIFNKWIEHTGWWPDYNIRLFKNGSVTWKNEIHSQPMVKGEVKELDAQESNAIVHYNYTSVSQYMTKLLTYTDIEAKEYTKPLVWQELITAPTQEFLRRFFVGKGYKDGIHGLVLSLLQAFSVFLVRVKVWELQGFEPMVQKKSLLPGLYSEFKKITGEVGYWFANEFMHEASGVMRAKYKLMRKRYKRKLG